MGPIHYLAKVNDWICCMPGTQQAWMHHTITPNAHTYCSFSARVLRSSFSRSRAEAAAAATCCSTAASSFASWASACSCRQTEKLSTTIVEFITATSSLCSGHLCL